jgi:hypothetical protein
MPKLTRDGVRSAVDTEAKFSEKWEANRRPGSLPDADKPVGEWLTYMRVYMAAAEEAVTRDDQFAALSNLRCLLNLGETCAMHRGMPERHLGDERDIY